MLANARPGRELTEGVTRFVIQRNLGIEMNEPELEVIPATESVEIDPRYKSCEEAIR